MNPLNSIPGTLITGLVLAILLVFGISGFSFGPINGIELVVWAHVFVGIIWIGLLYYFNFVQVPALGEAAADTDGPGPAAIGKYVAPRALWWFRWGALLTWLTGAYALAKLGIMHEAFTFENFTFATPNISAMGIGVWCGTIMLLNVWGPIWQNQKKLLGIKPASDAEKAKAKKVAFIASRTNTVLSIPMLLGMTAFGHGLPF